MQKKYSKQNVYHRSGFDRRADDDRRSLHNLDFLDHREDRRNGIERRLKPESRTGWVRYSTWCSVYVDDDTSDF